VLITPNRDGLGDLFLPESPVEIVFSAICHDRRQQARDSSRSAAAAW
jgi:hypothetical protein